MADVITTPAPELCETCAPHVHTKIEEREACHLAILDSIHDSVFAVDRDFNVITANKCGLERTFAITGIYLQPGDSILIQGRNQPLIDKWIAGIQRAMKGEAFKAQTQFVAGDKTIYREASFTPILQGGEIIGVSCYAKDVSESKRTEEKLKEQEMLFRTLLENSHDGIAMLSAGGRLKYISPSVRRILDFSFEEMSEIGMPGMVHPDDLGAVIRFSADLAPRYGQSDQIVYRMRTKAGGWRWIHCHYNNMLHEPAIKAFVVNYEDITNAKLAELQMDFDRRNRDTLINSTNDLMWSIDTNMRLITANNSFLSIIKAVANLDLQPGDELLTPGAYSEEELEDWAGKYKRVLSGEGYTEIVHRTHPFEYWAEISFNPMRENENIIGAACYSRDITESKKAELLLLQNQQMMAAAESIAHFGSWECDLHNLENVQENALRWSDEVFRIFGYEPGEYEASNENFFKAVHPDDREPIRQAFQTAIVENTSYSIQHRVLRPDGAVRWVHEEAKIVMDERTGKPLKMVGTVLDITNRKFTEESLRLSNERYELVTKATNDAIWDWNLLTNEVYWSEGYENLFGYPRSKDDFSSEIWTKRIHPQDVQRVWSSVNEAIQNPNFHSWQDEYRYIKSDGSIAHVHDRGYIIYKEDGTPVRMVGAMQDITAQKLAEESLMRSNERYEFATKATNDAIWDWNILTGELYWTEGYETLFGYSRDEDGFSFETCTKRIHPEDYERVRTSLHKEINDPSSHSWQGEYRYIKADGSIAHVHNRGYIVYNEDGIPARMVGAMQDITTQKLAEASLQKSEANLRTIFDHADRAFVLLDRNFTILSFNTVANEWAKLAYESEFTEGKSMLSYLQDGRKEEGRRILERVLAGQVFDHELQYPLPDGSVKWFSVRRYPVRNENGDILGICIATKDSTQRKNYELERDKMTAEIVQRNKDLEQFAYIVSHNLRAPVANIIGFSDALLHTDLNEDEKHEMLNGLDISITKLDTVIIDLNNILQVKKEVGEMKETVQLSRLVHDIALSIGHEIEKEHAIINIDFQQVDEMFTQKSYLYSIFYNLISNSIKYRKPDAPPVIEMKSRRLGNKIELRFSDNGLGIDLKRKNGQVFGLYKRFHPQAAEGKGMGLFMVKMQVENLGGKITVNSEVNVGTEFTIVFDG